MWIRYTSLEESGSTNEARDSGIWVKGGRGPDSEPGVEAPDDVVEGITEALVLLAFRADLAILLVGVVPVLACSPLGCVWRVVFGLVDVHSPDKALI